MSSSIKIKANSKKGIIAIVPIIIGLFVLVWSVWFFTYEQTVTMHISNIENAQSVESIIIHRTMERYQQLRMMTNPDTNLKYTDAEASEKANNEVYKVLMEKNGY